MLKCFRFAILLALGCAAGTTTVQADPQSFHLISISEIYTNCDGTKQFVELFAHSEFQTNLGPTRITALNADGTIETIVFNFSASFPALNAGETILLATAAMQTELGFAADFTIPANSLTLDAGRVRFRDDPPGNSSIDAIAYGAYTGSNTGFGLPAAAIPSALCESLNNDSLDLAPEIRDNSVDWSLGTPSPMRNSGTTGVVPCPPAGPPILVDPGDKMVDELQLLSFNITSSDPDCDPVTLTAEGVPSGANFIANGGNGSLAWTPNCFQSGVYPVTFIATAGGQADTELVTITVNELSDPAVARDTVANVDEDSQTAQNLQGYDPDDDPVVYTITSGPFFGQALNFNSATGAFTYQPNLNQVSGPPDLINFTITDNNCLADTGRWDVTVNPVNDAPVANNTSAGTTPNTLVAVGQMPASDVDNGSLIFSHTSGPFHGSVTNLNTSDGSFDYTPGLDYEGEDTIFYAASDGSLADTARVIIVISPGCVCNCHADPECDGNSTILDVISIINVAFRGVADVVDGACTHDGRSDTDCNCAVNVLDVVNMVNHAFRGDVTPFCDPCAVPCL